MLPFEYLLQCFCMVSSSFLVSVTIGTCLQLSYRPGALLLCPPVVISPKLADTDSMFAHVEKPVHFCTCVAYKLLLTELCADDVLLRF